MSKGAEDIFLQVSQIYLITITTQSRDFSMIKYPIPHHIYLCYKRRIKPNLFKSSETYISSSSGGERSSSSISSICDNSDAFSKPKKSLFVVFTTSTLVLSPSTSALLISSNSKEQVNPKTSRNLN